MKKAKLALASLSIAALFSSFASSANAASYYQDTDMISIWRVTQSGYIYSPVSVTNKVSIYATGVGSNWVTSKRELYSQTFANYWDVYPNAVFDTVALNIRGGNVTLPTLGTYIYNPDYVVVGRYNSNSATYSGASGASGGYGKSGFFAGSGGYQVDNTAQVDFTW